VAQPVAEARAYVQPQPAAYADATGWRDGRQRAGLWTVGTAWGTVFVGRRSRRGQVAHELLGAPVWGWLVSERGSAYTWYPTWRRQRCGALGRERGGPASPGPPNVPLVASGPGRHADAGPLPDLQAAHPAGDGAAAGGRPHVWRAQDRRDLPGHSPAASRVVDARAACGGGPAKPRGRAGSSSWRAVAHRECWPPACGRLTGR
jgi:Transposase IS66 family